MSRSRGYCFTLNNWTNDDVAQLMELTEDGFVSYLVIGFEIAPTTGTPHLQGYMHFDNGKTMRAVCDRVHRISLQEAKAQGENYDRRYLYCMKDDTKEFPEDYWEYGIRPHEGKNTSSDKVINAIKEGKKYDQLLELFPSFMMFHGKKVESYLQKLKKPEATKFYCINPVDDAFQECYEYFNWDEKTKVVTITELVELEAYEDYDHIILLEGGTFERRMNLWPRGAPITYRYGYELKKVICKKFIISTTTPRLYPLYKNIPLH